MVKQIRENYFNHLVYFIFMINNLSIYGPDLQTCCFVRINCLKCSVFMMGWLKGARLTVSRYWFLKKVDRMGQPIGRVSRPQAHQCQLFATSIFPPNQLKFKIIINWCRTRATFRGGGCGIAQFVIFCNFPHDLVFTAHFRIF